MKAIFRDVSSNYLLVYLQQQLTHEGAAAGTAGSHNNTTCLLC